MLAVIKLLQLIQNIVAHLVFNEPHKANHTPLLVSLQLLIAALLQIHQIYSLCSPVLETLPTSIWSPLQSSRISWRHISSSFINLNKLSYFLYLSPALLSVIIQLALALHILHILLILVWQITCNAPDLLLWIKRVSTVPHSVDIPKLNNSVTSLCYVTWNAVLKSQKQGYVSWFSNVVAYTNPAFLG